MKALITKVDDVRKSKRGETVTFRYVFFKDLETGKSYRSCISPEFRNYANWTGIKTGMILDNLSTKGTLVDADSDYKIVADATPQPKPQEATPDPTPSDTPKPQIEFGKTEIRNEKDLKGKDVILIGRVAHKCKECGKMMFVPNPRSRRGYADTKCEHYPDSKAWNPEFGGCVAFRPK